MGCLFFPIELLFDGIIEGWFYLMQWIVPEKMQNKTVRRILKFVIGFLSVLLMMCMFLGFFAIISDDYDTHQLGKYMVFIPLGISIVQIIFGIIVKIINKKKK